MHTIRITLVCFLIIVVLVSGVTLTPLRADEPVTTPPETFDELAGVIGRAEAGYVLHGFTDAPPIPIESRPIDTVDAEAQTTATYLPLVLQDVEPAPMVERRVIWVTRYDWTSIEEAAEQEAIDEIVRTVADTGFNTIFFQIRGGGSAFYTPGLEPWSSRITGSAWETLGQDPGWDPLARMLEKAHDAGLEVHAYVNVYSIWVAPPDESYGELAPPKTEPAHMFDRFTYGPDYQEHPGEYGLGYTWRQYDEEQNPMLLRWNTALWATPGRSEVQDHTVAVITDIVSRYDVDGVHLDFIRYAGEPYSYDPASNDAGGELKSEERDQWQRDRVTALVQRVSDETNKIRPGTLISAAVWPYYVDSWGWNGVDGSEGYNDYYQDSKGWVATGTLDAIAPMLYGGHADNFERWQILMKDFLADSAGRDVYPGIGGFNIGTFEDVDRRIQATRAAGARGHAIFSYGVMEWKGYWDELAAGPYAVPAVPPPHP